MSLSPEDEAVLQQLADHGDDPAIVGPIIHWFFGEQTDLETVAARLRPLGWANLGVQQDEDGWLMSPTKNANLQTASFLVMNSEIASASADLEVTYDGWETSVETRD